MAKNKKLNKKCKKRAQSPVRKFKMFERDAQRVCLQILKVSEESLGRDETPRQTSHEHFTSGSVSYTNSRNRLSIGSSFV